jgi:S-adenosylmethionine decarboxylase
MTELGDFAIDYAVIGAHGCSGDLHDGEQLLREMRRVAERAGAQPQGEARCQYVPHGVTAILFLAESHLLVSTWPEAAFAHVAISVCSPEVSCLSIWQRLRPILAPTEEELHELPPVVLSRLHFLAHEPLAGG